jgi:hypothetical protein
VRKDRKGRNRDDCSQNELRRTNKARKSYGNRTPRTFSYSAILSSDNPGFQCVLC